MNLGHIVHWGIFAVICLQATFSNARNLRSPDVIGVIDGVSDFTIWGWTCQVRHPRSIDIHIYVGGPAGEGTILKGFTANFDSEDAVARACQTSAKNYRFQVPITAEEAKEHAGKSIYIHGISTTGIGNNLLYKSGEFKMPPPTSGPPPTSSPSPTPTGTPEDTPRPTPWPTAGSSPSAAPTPAFTPEATPRPTPWPTTEDSSPSSYPSAAPTPTLTPEVTSSPTARPTQDVSTNPSSLLSPGPDKNNGVVLKGDMVVPNGETFILDSSITADLIKVEGKLVCPQNTETLEIITEGIVVAGKDAEFRCGTPTSPFRGKLTIKLKGNRDVSQIYGLFELGPKAIVAIDSGVINLHGTFGKEGFQYLQATAKPNDTQIKVVDASGWAKGDSIVIAPTNFNPYEAEQRSVANISPDGKYITLDTPLKYEHWGSVQQYQNGKGQAWDLDERAEVFNLNRNIRIMAENDESAIKGGHMIVRGSGSAAYVDNVEFYRMGQSGLMGRYPFHWHRKGDVNGQYIKNSSIHKSFQRCVVVHQTNYATVEGNTCFDHFGHGFFLEDGNEIKNRIVNNLGVLSRKPASENALLASDIGDGQNLARFPSPSTFWISHPDNYVKGNIAVASEGSGFWMAFVSNTLPSVYPPATPISSNTWVFDDNVAHSCLVGITHDGAPNGWPTGNPLNSQDRAITSAHYQPSQVPTFNNLVVFKCSEAGTYFRGNRAVYKNAIMADNKLSAFFAYDQEVVDSLIVGVSQNLPPKDGKLRHFCGVPVYDGPFFLDNVHFAGFSELPAAVSASAIDLLFGGYELFTNQVRRLTFDGSSPRKIRLNYKGSNWKDSYGASVRDIDGSLTGRAGSIVIPNHPMNSDSRCSELDGEDSTLVCDYMLGYLRFHDDTDNNGSKLDFKVTRQKEITGDSVSFLAENALNNKIPIILGEEYQYIFSGLPFKGGQRYKLYFYTMDVGIKSPFIEFRDVPDSCRIQYGDGSAFSGEWFLSTLTSCNRSGFCPPGQLKYSLFVRLETHDAPSVNKRLDTFRGQTTFEIVC